MLAKPSCSLLPPASCLRNSDFLEVPHFDEGAYRQYATEEQGR